MLDIRQLANPELVQLVPYEPGKPVADVARELGIDPSSIIKLASNENPLGPSTHALEVMAAALPQSHFYPDGGGYHLRNGIAEHFGLQRESVVLGCGSNEIIEMLFKGFTRAGQHEVVTTENAFAVYALLAQLFGVKCVRAPEKNFEADCDAMLRAVTPQTRLIFLASPNNPTGTRVSNAALDRFLRALPDHVITVLDEAYYEFMDQPPDTIAYVKEGLKIVLLRTFSKIQGLAGLRIGYGLAEPVLGDLLQRTRQPFNTSSIAQLAALASLKDAEHIKKTREITDAGRKRLEETFRKMKLPYVPSSANFVLVKVGDGNAVFQRLMKRGIIVRSMVSYRLPEYIRVSVGTPEQMDRFFEELAAAMKG
jgi:histidinol-phosphate aminotransferase